MVDQTDAFAITRSQRRGVARSPAVETLWRLQPRGTIQSLRALPVDTDAIRFLSEAAGSGTGINTKLIEESLGSTALNLFGACAALGLIGVLGLSFLSSLVVEDIADIFILKLQEDYPEKYEEIQKLIKDTVDESTDAGPREESAKSNKLLVLGFGGLDGSDATTDAFEFAVEKKLGEMFGVDEELKKDR